MNNRHRSKHDSWLISIAAITLYEVFVGGSAVCSASDSKNLQQELPAAEALYREGLDHYKKWELAIAVEKFSQVIAKGKKTANVYSYLGEALSGLERYDEALTNLSEAIRLDPRDVHAFTFRGLTHAQLGNREEAIQDFSAGLAITPNELMATLLEARGETYWAIGRLEKAAEDFEAIIAHDPKGARGYFLRGKLLGAKGKFREAIDDWSSALDRDATRKIPLFYRGYGYICLKEYDKALRDYTALLQAVPEAAIVHAYRGWIHGRLENHRLAETDLTYAREHGYRQPFVYLFLAHSLAAQGQIDQALTINKEMFSLSKGEARAFMEGHFQRGYFLLMKKQYGEARSFYEKGIAVARKLGLQSALSRTLTDLRKASEGDAEMRRGGTDILRMLEDSGSHVQSNALYDKPSACELASPLSTADKKDIPMISEGQKKKSR